MAFFYEIHEGAADLLTNSVLVSDRQLTPAEFEAAVRAARAAVVETFEEDTLAEAVARELEKNHGFTFVSDDKLIASMSVDVEDDDTYLLEPTDEFRTLVVDLDLG